MSFNRVLRWLAVAAATDWFFGRTLSRSAIFVPKSPFLLRAYEALTAVGQFAANLTSLLVILSILWIALRSARRGSKVLPALITALTGLTLLALATAPGPSARLATHLIVSSIAVALAAAAVRRSGTSAQAAAVVLPAAAILAAALYQAAGAIGTLQEAWWSEVGLAFFALGEAFVVASGFALFWMLRPRPAERWLAGIALIPALGFAGLYLAAPAISGVLAIWSLGLTLYLPWPLYAASLWAGAAAALIGLKRGHVSGWAIAMLVSAGYAPQLSTHMLLSLIGLYQLGQTDGVTADAQRAQPAAQAQGRLPGLGVEPR